MPSPIRTTIQDDHNHLFLCLESDTLPLVPARGIPLQDPKSLWLPDPNKFMERSWASDTMPYQGFLPVHRSCVYQCVLFKCLNYSSASIPLFSPSPGQWALETRVADEWKHLENLLGILRKTLGQKLDCVERFPYPRFPPPWEYGYHHAKCHKMDMEDAAMRSRDAFLVLAGEISFLLALTLAEKDGDDWEITLTEEVGGNWTDLIRTSWLVQNDSGFWQGEEASRRVGLFVDPRVCENVANFLEAYTAYSIPVWIDWGPITSPFEALDRSLSQKYAIRLPPNKVVHRTTAKHIEPQARDVQLGIRWQAGEMSVANESEQTMLQQTTEYVDVRAASCSDETRVSAERDGRSKKLQLLDKSANEKHSHHARAAKLDRYSEEQQYPTRSVDVFVREKVRVDNKDYVERRHISDSDIPQQQYPPLPRERGAEASVRKLTASSLRCSRPCSAEAWEKAYVKLFEAQTQVLKEDLEPKEYEYWSLKDVLRFRFGIQIARPTDPGPLTQEGVENSSLLSLGEFVSWLAWHASKKEDSGNHAITASHVQPPHVLSCTISAAWWDLSPQSHSYLGKDPSSLGIQAVQWHDGSEERTGYRIQVQGESKVLDQRYLLIVYRADDVLHCLRLSGVTRLDDLIEELCCHGIRFTVGVQADPSGPKLWRKSYENGCQARHTQLIPYRPANFKAGLLDYISYVRRRAALLHDPVVARAALMHGGIIWRLAMEHTEDYSAVLRRPTDDIFCYGKCHRLTVLGREKCEIFMWEESLSESQMDVMCGVYKMYNRSPDGYSLTQDMSWFPKDASFKYSALNVGFWTADAEKWYTRRVDMYLSPNPEKSCLNQAGWRSSVRLWRCAIATYKGLETVSKHFVDRHVLASR